MSNSALILIDYINEIIHPDGKFASKGYPDFAEKRNTVARVNTALKAARERDFLVIFVNLGFSSNYSEHPEGSPLFGPAKKFGALTLGSWATELFEGINTEDSDILLTKHRVSAFYCTALEAVLRSHQVSRLYIGGVSTDLAVQTTARDAHDRDYDVNVIHDICAAGSDDDHNQTIQMLRKVCKIIDSDESFIENIV